jgi:GNAT superfamily N-acetyltransferase
MSTANPELTHGLSNIPKGHLANVVTCLEMTARSRAHDPHGFAPPYVLVPFTGGIAGYRTLYRRIGADWMWVSRLIMPDAKLEAILASPLVEPFVLEKDGDGIGLLELDFREEGECELTFFGLAREAIGAGLGRALMDQALARAWAKPIRRLWVHTCTFDHPAALPFYIRSGFKPYALQVEVHPDPRLTGHLPRHAAPHIALIDP